MAIIKVITQGYWDNKRRVTLCKELLFEKFEWNFLIVIRCKAQVSRFVMKFRGTEKNGFVT